MIASVRNVKSFVCGAILFIYIRRIALAVSHQSFSVGVKTLLAFLKSPRQAE